MAYRIRPVEPSDEQQWVILRHALFGDGKTVHAQEVRRFLSGVAPEPLAVLVAVDGDRILGLVELSIRPHAEGCSSSKVGYLEGWYVRPDVRRQGVGRALVHAAEQWARDQGCTEFASDTVVENESSARAHEACGFTEVAQVKCFYKPLVPASSDDPPAAFG